MRVSIRPQTQTTLEQLSSKLGISDTSELVNYIILDYNRGLLDGHKTQTPLTVPTIGSIPELEPEPEAEQNPIINLSELFGSFR